MTLCVASGAFVGGSRRGSSAGAARCRSQQPPLRTYVLRTAFLAINSLDIQLLRYVADPRACQVRILSVNPLINPGLPSGGR